MAHGGRADRAGLRRGSVDTRRGGHRAGARHRVPALAGHRAGPRPRWLRRALGLVDQPSGRVLGHHLGLLRRARRARARAGAGRRPHARRAVVQRRTINYARNALRAARTDPGRVALIYRSERAGRGALTYGELAGEVARVAGGLRDLGVRTGDRVAGLLPNGPHAIIALLAAASIGAVWSSCSPDFGAASVIDRFAQIEPTVLIAVDGYAYGGKEYRRDDVVRQIAAELPGLAAVVMVGGAARPGAPSAAARAPRTGRNCSTGTAWVRRAAPNRTTRTCRSIIRCGCSTPRAPPACPSRSCTVTAASSWSTSRPCPSTRIWGPATCSSGTPRPAG